MVENSILLAPEAYDSLAMACERTDNIEKAGEAMEHLYRLAEFDNEEDRNQNTKTKHPHTHTHTHTPTASNPSSLSSQTKKKTTQKSDQTNNRYASFLLLPPPLADCPHLPLPSPLW